MSSPAISCSSGCDAHRFTTGAATAGGAAAAAAIAATTAAAAAAAAALLLPPSAVRQPCAGAPTGLQPLRKHLKDAYDAQIDSKDRHIRKYLMTMLVDDPSGAISVPTEYRHIMHDPVFLRQLLYAAGLRAVLGVDSLCCPHCVSEFHKPDEYVHHVDGCCPGLGTTELASAGLVRCPAQGCGELRGLIAPSLGSRSDYYRHVQTACKSGELVVAHKRLLEARCAPMC